MARHSKNNNASSVFTYSERQKLKYGTQEMRVGRDSLRNYDACYLCLDKNSVKGHMACKECIYSNILAQKREIARQSKTVESERIIEKEQDEMAKEEQKKKEQEIFLQTQQSLIPSSISSGTTSQSTSSKGTSVQNSFWIPSKTPENTIGNNKKEQLKVKCPFSSNNNNNNNNNKDDDDNDEHGLNIKKLITVIFTKDAKNSFSCPSCLKVFTNSSELCLSRNCGHVLCKNCTDKFTRRTNSCLVCGGKAVPKDMITLYNEGTGFSSRGQVEIKRFDLAFKA